MPASAPASPPRSGAPSASPGMRATEGEDARAFLARGGPWPDQPPPACIETEAAWLFLTRDRAWKLRKPVGPRHAGPRGLDERERLCREELRLNRELAGPGVHLGVAALVRRPGGGLELGGPGRVADWLIEMARLPAGAMLDRRMEEGPPPACEAIEAVCDVMLGFYAARPSPAEAGPARLDRLLREARRNARRLVGMADASGCAPRAELLDFALSGLEERRSEILRRGAEGRFVEGHGDLRAGHVCLLDPPVIFGRRACGPGAGPVDPYDEFEGLGLECQAAGHGWIRAVLLARLAKAGPPPPSPRLLAVYGVNRCLTRARLAIERLADPRPRPPAPWPPQARRALDLAATLFDRAPG